MIQFRPADRVDPNGSPVRNESVIQLVRGIVQDARTLSVKELAAAKLETKQEIGKIAKAGVSFGAGVFLLALGVIFLSLMLVLVLEQYTVLLLWQSLGAVGLFYAVIGAVVLAIGKHKAASVRPIPEKSLRGAKEDIRYLSERATGH